MSFRTELTKPKQSLEYYLKSISKGDLVIFGLNNAKLVTKHNKGSHYVTLDDGKEYNLDEIYGSVCSIYTVRDPYGNYSKQYVKVAVFGIVRYLNENTKYHAYPEAIVAILKGNKKHYLYPQVKCLAGFGMIPNITSDDVDVCLAMLEFECLLKSGRTKSGKVFYKQRKDHRLWKRDFVFYIAYGSNLSEDKLDCYFTGKENKKLGIKKRKPCKNPNHYVLRITYRIPYEMYFGGSSEKWDGGGVCFLKPTKTTDSKKFSFATGYLITRDQYEYIRDCEGRSKELYGKEIDLDPIACIPAKTFTSEVVHKFNKPSEKYLNIVRLGLVDWGLTHSQATRYLYAKTHKKDK